MTPNELAHELEKIYGDNLKSVVLYGSAVDGDHSKKFSDINIFCVLARPTPAVLAKANPAVRKWVKKGNPPPHFFGPEHIERSLDVFPMEFLDMMDRHKVILGRDPLESVNVDIKNLRHQCESEFKGKLIHLRAFYAANCNDTKAIARMMVQSFSTFLAGFRAALRLVGERPPLESRKVIEMAAAHLGFKPGVFAEIIEIRSGTSLLPRGNDALIMFEQYLTEIETVTNYIDKLETGRKL